MQVNNILIYFRNDINITAVHYTYDILYTYFQRGSSFIQYFKRNHRVYRNSIISKLSQRLGSN